MADNTQIVAGSGDVVSTEDIGGGVKLARSKIALGAHDVDGGDVTATNPFPITGTVNVLGTIQTNPNVTLAASNITQAVSGSVNVGNPSVTLVASNITQAVSGT